MLSEAHATMYADDTTISYLLDNMEDLGTVINSELSSLNRWLQGNKLYLVNQTRYLGLIIDDNLKWDGQIKVLVLSEIVKELKKFLSRPMESPIIGASNETRFCHCR